MMVPDGLWYDKFFWDSGSAAPHTSPALGERE